MSSRVTLQLVLRCYYYGDAFVSSRGKSYGTGEPFYISDSNYFKYSSADQKTMSSQRLEDVDPYQLDLSCYLTITSCYLGINISANISSKEQNNDF